MPVPACVTMCTLCINEWEIEVVFGDTCPHHLRTTAASKSAESAHLPQHALPPNPPQPFWYITRPLQRPPHQSAAVSNGYP